MCSPAKQALLATASDDDDDGDDDPADDAAPVHVATPTVITECKSA